MFFYNALLEVVAPFFSSFFFFGWFHNYFNPLGETFKDPCCVSLVVPLPLLHFPSVLCNSSTDSTLERVWGKSKDFNAASDHFQPRLGGIAWHVFENVTTVTCSLFAVRQTSCCRLLQHISGCVWCRHYGVILCWHIFGNHCKMDGLIRSC